MQPDPHENLKCIQDYCFEQGTVARYIKGNFLGKGGFARCYEVKLEGATNMLAVKIIQKSSLVKQRSKLKLMSEIKIHRSLDHYNVVKFFHEFEDNANVYILLELCTNKTLNDLLKRKKKLTESQARYYMSQLLDGLQYLHEHCVIHRDLKLGNLFLSQDMKIKIGDFGLASRLQYRSQKRKTVCGTPNYIAPEVLQAKGHSFQVDIWSFGVIAYTLIYGRPPFESKDVKDTYKKIKAGIYTFPQQINTSSSFKYLVSSCLKKDPTKRPSIKELRLMQFFRGPNLSRQPSISFKSHLSISGPKDQKQLSDNGKLYTNNDLMTSKDTARQKSQDRFLVTDRHMNSTNKSLKNNLQRSGSQRILKETTSQLRTDRYTPPTVTIRKNGIIEVKKWIDYSSKYGIGYILSNNNFGVYFNDSTKMIASNQETFYYIQKVDREDVTRKYCFKDYPIELKKKVSLFHHFKGYLRTENSQNTLHKKLPIEQKDLIYVRRWFRAKHAVIFRLNNKSVQVIFIDQSQLIISATNKEVVYINKNKQRLEYSLADIMQSENRQLIKRFQYTKEVLNQMASHHQQKKK